MAAILACAVVAILIASMPKQKEVEPKFVFSYAENQGEEYPTTLGAKYFSELVEKRTEGRIRILVQAEGTLGNEKEVILQMKYGGIDFARVSLSQLAEYAPELNVLQMPYLYEDSTHMWRVLDGEIGAKFLNGISDDELVGLSWYDAGARNFYNSKKPISCLEDMEGMKIRVQESDNRKQSRADTIFTQFIHLVEKNFRHERKVGWYAEQLCITPKYLSETVKSVSTRTPNEWIDSYVTLELRVLLKTTTKSVKEIAEEMNFPNQSFLGKFFREHVGVSPTLYRKQ